MGKQLWGCTIVGTSLRVEPIRVAILDDHQLIVDGLAAMLASAPASIEVAATASRWADLLASPALPVDVVVIDLHLGDGILITAKVHALSTMGSATVVISRHADAPSVSAAMNAGALAFVGKSDSAEDLIAAIIAAADGSRHLSEQRSQALAESLSMPDPGLGKQEQRALVLYAGGRSIREVALDMETTEETVKSYIKRGRRKYRQVGIDIGTRMLLRRHAAHEGWLNHR